MPASIPAFRAETFEYVEAGPGLALFRLAGFWSEADPPAGSVYLVVTKGDGDVVELPPLPAPQAGSGQWRAAYSAPGELLDDELATFALEGERGDPIPLPAPVERGVQVAEPAPVALSEPEPEPEPVSFTAPATTPEPRSGGFFARRRAQDHLKRALAGEREARREAERAAADERARAERAESSLREELRTAVDRAAELLARIGDYEDSRVTFPEELDAVRETHAELLEATREEHRLELEALREELDAMRRELEAARREAATANEQLDVAHEAQALELASARRQRDAALERQEQLEGKLSAAGEQHELEARQLAEREELLERARSEAAVALDESAEMQATAERLRDAIARRARHDSRAMRIHTPAELDVTPEELQQGIDRLAALERQAEALRDAIYAELPPRPGESPLQEALPLASADDRAEAELEFDPSGSRAGPSA